MQPLIDHLRRTTGLPQGEIERIVADVVDYFAEPLEDLVRRRHSELKTYGAKNRDIFPTIAEELAGRVVAPPRLTERQLRRIVHG